MLSWQTFGRNFGCLFYNMTIASLITPLTLVSLYTGSLLWSSMCPCIQISSKGGWMVRKPTCLHCSTGCRGITAPSMHTEELEHTGSRQATCEHSNLRKRAPVPITAVQINNWLQMSSLEMGFLPSVLSGCVIPLGVAIQPKGHVLSWPGPVFVKKLFTENQLLIKFLVSHWPCYRVCIQNHRTMGFCNFFLQTLISQHQEVIPALVSGKLGI